MAGVPVRWEGAILTDRRGLRGPAVDLLQWTSPATAGVPYPVAHHLGFRALLFGASDQEATAARLAEIGAPVERRWNRDERGVPSRVLVTRDPGGTTLEIRAGAPATTYLGVRVNCSDLDRSVEWYAGTLGLDRSERRSVEVLGEPPDDDQASGRYDVVEMFVPHRHRSFRLELTEWRAPVPVGVPYAIASHAGIYRVALTVEDLEVSYADLRQSVPEAPKPVTVDLGETLGPMQAMFFPDPDGNVVELLEQGLR